MLTQPTNDTFLVSITGYGKCTVEMVWEALTEAYIGPANVRRCYVPVPPDANERIATLEEALSAMLTHMGMDEDEFNKSTFDQARAALEKP